MILDSLHHLHRYGDSPALLMIDDFCRKRLRSVGDGSYDLLGDGSVVAMIEARAPGNRREARLEAHRRFADLHTVIEGTEAIEWFNGEGLVPSTSYQEDRDVLFFETPKRTVARFELTPGLFAIMTPSDAHITGLLAGSPGESIRKAVFKIAVDRLDLLA